MKHQRCCPCPSLLATTTATTDAVTADASRGIQRPVYRPVGEFPLPAVPDAALKDLSLRAFEHIWPVMEERLEKKMRRERYVNLGLGLLATLSYVALFAALRPKKGAS